METTSKTDTGSTLARRAAARVPMEEPSGLYGRLISWYSRRTYGDVLDPANWSLLLKTSSGAIYQPSSTTVLAATQTPREGFWEGTVRVWFPWRDPVTKNPLVGGQNAWVSLRLSHPSGAGEATWRFRPGF